MCTCGGVDDVGRAQKMPLRKTERETERGYGRKCPEAMSGERRVPFGFLQTDPNCFASKKLWLCTPKQILKEEVEETPIITALKSCPECPLKCMILKTHTV